MHTMQEAAAVLLLLLACAQLPVGVTQPAADLGQLIRDSLTAAVASSQQQLVVPVHGNSTLAAQATQAVIVVPSNTSISLQGIDSVASTLTWLPGQNSSVLELQAGAMLTLANMTLTVAEPLPPGALTSTADGVYWAELFSLPGLVLQPGSTLQVVNTVVLLPDCSVLASYQDVVCTAAQTPELELFTAPRVRPGRLLFVDTGSDDTSPANDVQHIMTNVSLACPPSLPTLRVDLPGAPPAQLSDPAVQQLQTLAAQLGPTPCLIRQVRNAVRLLDDLQQAANMVRHDGLLVLQMIANISLSEVVWPADGVYLTNHICLAGPPAGSRQLNFHPFHGLELDIAGVPTFLVLDQDRASMSISNLCLTNLPLGKDNMFPNSLVVSAMWSIEFDRAAANRTMLLFRNSQLVVPADLFSYISYWVGLQSSTVPSVRATADWLQDNVYFGVTLGGADKHSLIFYRREGQGTLWVNSTLTDLPYKSPQLIAATGISDLMPDVGPLVPFNQVRPVFNATHLASELLNTDSAASHLVLIRSMQLTQTAIQQAIRQSTSTQATSSSSSSLVVINPVTIIGRPPASMTGAAAGLPQVLDFSGAVSLFTLAIPQGTRLTLQRLTVTGLGPYNLSNTKADSNTTSPALLGNLTCALWAFDFPRRQSKLRLVNTTLVVSLYELQAIDAALGQPTSTPQPLVQPAALQAIGNAFSMVDDHIQQASSALVLSDVAFIGIEGVAVTITSTMPPKAALPGMTPAVTLLLTLTPSTSSTSSNGTDVLSAGGVVAVVVGSITLLAVMLTSAWMWHRCMRQKQLHDSEQSDKAASVRSAPLGSVDISPSDTGSLAHRQSIMVNTMGHASLSHAHSGSHATHATTNQTGENDASSTDQVSRSQLVDGSMAASKVSQPTTTSMHKGTDTSSRDGQQSCEAHAANTAEKGVSSNQLSMQLQHGHREAHAGEVLPEDAMENNPEQAPSANASSLTQTPAEPAPLRRGTTKLDTTGPTLMQVAQEAVSLSRRSPALDMVGTVQQAGGDVEGAVFVTGSEGLLSVSGKLAKAKLEKDPTGGGESNGSGRGAAGVEGAAKRPVFEQGLAAGGEECEPELLLQQVIAHRKEIQGVDMQQIEFQQILGQGSFGVVYKGTWRSLTVAIKTLLFHDAITANRVRQRAITEAAINTLLTHNNIVNTFSYELRPVATTGMPEERHTAYWKLYIIQEYCDGGSLAQAVDRGLFMDPRTGRNNMLRVLQVARDIAQGMAYIHANNVIHGDLSAGNILLRNESGPGRLLIAKVGDFGLSRFLEGPEHSHISNARQGTPFYMAPEVLSRGIISQSADVFSFGVLLWEMFCGTPPWRSQAGVALQTLNPQTYPYHVPITCPVEYHELILACLAENPKARPRFASLVQRISELLLMLKDAITVLLNLQQQEQAHQQPAVQRVGQQPMQQQYVGQQQQQQRPLQAQQQLLRQQQQQQLLQLKVQQKWQQLTQTGAVVWRAPQQLQQQPGQDTDPTQQPGQQAGPIQLLPVDTHGLQLPADALHMQHVQQPVNPEQPSPPAWQQVPLSVPGNIVQPAMLHRAVVIPVAAGNSEQHDGDDGNAAYGGFVQSQLTAADMDGGMESSSVEDLLQTVMRQEEEEEDPRL